MSVYQTDYPGRAACEGHWAKVRADIVAGRAGSAPVPTKTLEIHHGEFACLNGGA